MKLSYLERKKNRLISLNSSINRVKEVARRDTWCTNHSNCFRASFSQKDKNAESDRHRDKKYETWVEYRKMGCVVFVELRLLNGCRPDLIVCFNNGDVEIVEIVESETEKSILIKKDKYPFPLRVVKT